MKKILIATATWALIFTGCSNNEEFADTRNPNNAIGFGVTTDKAQTKATDNSTGKIQETGFGIFASYTVKAEFDDTQTHKMDFMWNQKVTYDNAWTYTPLKYWPNEKDEYISFFAYAPYSATGTSTKTATGYPTVDFVLAAPKDQVDFVYDDYQKDHSTSLREEVVFSLKHALSRVAMKAYVAPDLVDKTGKYSYVCITGVSIDQITSEQYFTKGTFHFGGTGTNRKPYWTVSDPTSSAVDLATILNCTTDATKKAKLGTYETACIDLSTDANAISANAVSLFANNEYLFLLPPGTTSTDGDTGLAADKIAVTISYDIVTPDTALEKGYSVSSTTKTVSLPAGTLKMGTAYTYIFKIGITGIVVSATVDSNWADGTSGEIEILPAVDEDSEEEG